MSISFKPVRVRFDSDSFHVDLSDGRVIDVPLTRFPRLLRATSEQLEQVRMSKRGLHWEALDEDISIAGLIAGRGDQTKVGREYANAHPALFQSIWTSAITLDDRCSPDYPSILTNASVRRLLIWQQKCLTTVAGRPIA